MNTYHATAGGSIRVESAAGGLRRTHFLGMMNYCRGGYSLVQRSISGNTRASASVVTALSRASAIRERSSSGVAMMQVAIAAFLQPLDLNLHGASRHQACSAKRDRG